MNFAKKVLSYFLPAFLLFGNLTPITSAAQSAMTDTISAESYTIPASSLPESDELYEGYLEQLFYPTNSISFLGEAAKNQLTPLGQSLYGVLKTNLLAVSSGASSSTSIRLSAEQISAWGGTISYEKSESQTAQQAAAAALSHFKEEFEVDNVVSALLHDCPYALYWYDKVTGVTESGTFSLSGNNCILQSVDFKFSVVEDMQAENYSSDNPTFDTSNIAAATAAANNAQDLVDRFANYTDHAKLLAYKDEICSLVSYNKAAASNGDFSTDADPWQLIYVFDQDSTTNVVCEGYSKAFQYLYDLSAFSGRVDCITVLGTMSGGGHMWNIVTINERNYLTDITNSDSDTAGADGSLFLAGADGDINSGYVVKGLTYTYDSSTLALWGCDEDSKLNIAAEIYKPCVSGHTEVIDPAVDPTCTETGLSAGAHCSACGQVLTAQQTIPATGHDYETKVITPTCTDAGYTTHICSACGDQYTTNPADALGHDWQDATCTAPKTCAACGTQEGPALGHSEVIDPAVDAKCTETGLSAGAHCSACGQVLTEQQTIPAAGHDYDTKVVTPTCTDVGYTTQICSACGDQYTTNPVDALGHDWQDATCTAPKTCAACAAQEGPVLGHSFLNDWDTSCEVCNYIRELDIMLSPMYRLYNPYTQEHLLTSNEAEKSQLEHIGWHFDGVAWKTPSKGDPVYRLYNPFDDWHTYSMSQEEIDILVPLGWKVDGVVCYSAVGNTDTPIYRLFNPYAQINYHLLTAAEEERDWLLTLGWTLDGVGWYGVR